MIVKVWNDNVHPYREQFRDRVIEIPAKKCIEMELDEAELFRGSFSPIVVDADGNPTPEGFKMIRIERPKTEDAASESKQTICMACNKDLPSVKALQDHIFAEHKDIAVVDEEAEKALKRKATKATA